MLPVPLRAQEVGGALEGRVLDAAGAPALDATATISGSSLQGTRVVRSDRDGRFQCMLLPVGRYDVQIRLLGYREATVRDVHVQLGFSNDLGVVHLEVEAIALPGAEVSANRNGAARRPVLGGRFSAEAMRDLPSDRDYQSIVTLSPHASVSYFGDRANLGGTSGPESNYYVDGANVVEPPGNAVSTSLPYNFVEAVHVSAGGYQAEYGGAGGGVVNAVTASGGNEFTGQVFGFFANRLFTTTSTPARGLARTTDFSSWDAGASIGGPIRRDRLWFYLAYDPTIEDESLTIPGYGADQDLRTSHRFAGKLTARLDDRTHVVLSALGDPGHREQVGGTVPLTIDSLGNVDPFLGAQDGGGGTISLHATRSFGSRWLAAADAALFASRYTFGPRTTQGAAEPLFVDLTTSYAEGGFGSSTDRHAGRSSVGGTVGYQQDRNTWKAGGAYEDEYFRERLMLDQITRRAPQLYAYVTLPDHESRNHIRAPSLFVQDTWRMSRRVRIDAGLRWSAEYWMASGGSVGQHVSGQWQPRAGFSWVTGDASRASLFGSWGRFDQRTRLNVPAYFLQDVSSTYLVRAFDHDPRVDPTGGVTKGSQTLGHQPEVPGLRGAEFDELQLGAEYVMGGAVHARVRAVSRSQENGVVGVTSPVSGQVVYGNPGDGELGAYPAVARRYRALELTVESDAGESRRWSASYVESSLEGNYEGYWDQSAGTNDPLGGGSFMPFPDIQVYASGPLPSDRPHQIKANASSLLGHGFSAGLTLLWASGTPISELGSTPYPPPYFRLLAPRGSLGRTPSIYDVSLRIAYEPGFAPARIGKPRLLADVYHIGNPRRAVVYDQLRYLAVDDAGNQSSPNPNYGHVLQFQPQVAYRLGFELGW